jgi:transcriptional regulator with XRE-family HTH domain
MKTLNNYIDEQLKKPEVKSEYDALEEEYVIIRAIIEVRNRLDLTQKDLSDITGISQADISKIENGTRNPSLKLLKRLADGMNMNLELKFVPKSEINC